MRVKRLEIQGFKSFKDKTVIHFDHNITGIVGPNGCGKSNIVDAFFWVMGEQSYKHMRGASSEDLIFNGSSRFSPLGMAEATLVMETGEAVDTAHAAAGASFQDIPLHLRTKEISVTRRLYRSGEGQYFINGTLARLKDIQELFMDTGVGAKGYSVIEQGQIGKIVNAKPEERRLLIEEAAGIAKYKARKKESLRKMEATEANLSRLTDIIQEIEKNLTSLERQAQKAKLYKKYKDELLEKEMTWGRRKNEVLRQKLESLRNQRDALEQELMGLRAELQTAENSIEIERIKLVTETKSAEEIQSDIQDFAARLSQERSALELSKRRQGDLATQRDTLEAEKEELEASLSTDSGRLEEIEEHAKEADELFQTAAHEVSEMSESLRALRKEFDAARSHLDASQRELMTGMHQISDLTSKAAGLLSKADSAREQATRLSEQAETQSQKLTTIEDELKKSQLAAEEMQTQREHLQAEIKIQTAQLRSGEQEVRELESKKNASHRAVTQIQSKLQSLEELDESHEGLADGPKAALDWAKAHQKGNQLCALTDVLEVSNGYESALEVWLETRIESLISQESDFVLPLLEQIRVQKQGRVSIQLAPNSASKAPSTPLEKASSAKPLNEVKLLLEKQGFKVLGELSDFVKLPSGTEESLRPMIQQMIQNVCLVESSAPFEAFLTQVDAIEELQAHSGWSVVSLDGIALESSGLIRGGSFNASGAVGVLKRKRAIEELKIQAEQAEIQHQEAEEGLYQSKQGIEILRGRVQTIQQDLQSLEIQSAGLQRDVHQTQRALQEAKNHLASLLKDGQAMNLQVEQALQNRESIEARLQEMTSHRAALETTISSAESDLLEKEQAMQGEDSDLQTVRLREASTKERAVSLKRELEAVKSLIADRKRRLTELHRTLDRALREHEQFSGGESELSVRIQELTISLADAREKFALIKNGIEQSNAQLNKNLERVKELHKLGDQKSSQSNQVALELEKFSGEISHLILNLEEKYGPGCLDRAPTSSEASDPNETTPPRIAVEISAEEELTLSEEVERLRERIRRLGEVNVMAIEEFEQLKKRFDHLLIEKVDLERSMANLKDAIDHINKTSEERFKKAFEAIAERFERLFPIVFGGGQAKMSLVYPENSKEILDAGVDILAQPPGKKIANMTLLSGGEKALTAVSLIFAIFMVKPSPFCVLDEVDAPLDDANIGKFNALLREMSSKSQFILITHNKKTMELNDTLYGVTMEEPGVSKMVSIEMQ